jgi:hypothetical protein
MIDKTPTKIKIPITTLNRTIQSILDNLNQKDSNKDLSSNMQNLIIISMKKMENFNRKASRLEIKRRNRLLSSWRRNSSLEL